MTTVVFPDRGGCGLWRLMVSTAHSCCVQEPGIIRSKFGM